MQDTCRSSWILYLYDMEMKLNVIYENYRSCNANGVT